MSKLKTSEKAKRAKQVMKAGAKSVVNGKLNQTLLQKNLTELVRENAKKHQGPQPDKK